MEKHMDRKGTSWDIIARLADELFDYLLHNYDKLLDGDHTIKHFIIEEYLYDVFDFHDEFIESYGDIQKALVPWIRNEFSYNELLNIDNWKPFRDQNARVDMFLGYRKLFKYRQYYFQLSFQKGSQCTDCFYCKNGDSGVYLGLMLYGWKDNNNDDIQPMNFVNIPDDNWLPDSFWNKKE